MKNFTIYMQINNFSKIFTRNIKLNSCTCVIQEEKLKYFYDIKSERERKKHNLNDFFINKKVFMFSACFAFAVCERIRIIEISCIISLDMCFKFPSFL